MKKAFGGAPTKETAEYMEGKDPKVPVYKPGETPPSKYRGPWNQAHQDKLQSFSFSNAFGRRKSSQGASDYSPTASRRQSTATTGRKSMQKPRQPSHVGQVVENAAGDDDPANGRLRFWTPMTPCANPWQWAEVDRLQQRMSLSQRRLNQTAGVSSSKIPC